MWLWFVETSSSLEIDVLDCQIRFATKLDSPNTSSQIFLKLSDSLSSILIKIASNCIEAKDNDAKGRLSSDTLRSENSSYGVLGRSGGVIASLKAVFPTAARTLPAAERSGANMESNCCIFEEGEWVNLFEQIILKESVQQWCWP